MAATIVPFPSKIEQNTNEIDNLIRKWLDGITGDPDMIDGVAGRMMKFITTYASEVFEPSFNLVVPPGFSQADTVALLQSLEKGVNGIADQVQQMVNRIIIERFLLEVQLYEKEKQAIKTGWHQV